MLDDEQRRAFAVDGFVVLSGLVDDALLAAADAEVDELERRDPPPPDGVGPHSWFLPPGDLPAADTALRRSGALAAAASLVAPLALDHAHDHVQITLNRPPYPTAPGAPHLDGFRPGEPIATFTVLAGIPLGDETGPGQGNLWVWPGSHRTHERMFATLDPALLQEAGGHPVFLDPPVFEDSGRPLLVRRGDVVLAHHLLGHNIGDNTGDRVRRALYFRLAATGHAERWEAALADAFLEYQPLRDLAP